mgnify:CR=1 FL=1
MALALVDVDINFVPGLLFSLVERALMKVSASVTNPILIPDPGYPDENTDDSDPNFSLY